jgi:hypothetical protein
MPKNSCGTANLGYDGVESSQHYLQDSYQDSESAWQDSEIVRSPNGGSRYFILGRLGGKELGYVVDLVQKEVSVPNMSFTRFGGVVLQKDPKMLGALMALTSDKEPFDPELRIATNKTAFSFRTEERRLISVSGL